jgi:VanZ family protein
MQRRQVVAVVTAIVWMGVIFSLSALPGSALPGRFSGLGHFTVYTVLGLLYCAALGKRRTWWHALAIAVVLASLYGVTDEFHQSFVPGRTPDVLDWLVDTVGAAVGAGLFTLLAGRLRGRSAVPPC